MIRSALCILMILLAKKVPMGGVENPYCIGGMVVGVRVLAGVFVWLGSCCTVEVGGNLGVAVGWDSLANAGGVGLGLVVAVLVDAMVIGELGRSVGIAMSSTSPQLDRASSTKNIKTNFFPISRFLRFIVKYPFVSLYCMNADKR